MWKFYFLKIESLRKIIPVAAYSTGKLLQPIKSINESIHVTG